MPETFEAPIPGQSLTGELGSKPWEQPAKYDTVEDTLDFYLERLSNMDLSMGLFEAIDDGLPVTTAVDLLLASGNMDGLHTMDVATLAAPVLAEFVVAVCEKLDLNFSMEGEESKKIDKAQLDKVMSEISYDYMSPEEEEEAVEEEPIQLMGLMSRGGV
jgi:hypothetical protein